MYHSHFREAQQMGSGLYGPIIVVEPGQRFDPETDKTLFFGTAGRLENAVFGPLPAFVMNGKTQPDAMDLKAGTRYRFRLFNLAGDSPLMPMGRVRCCRMRRTRRRMISVGPGAPSWPRRAAMSCRRQAS